jgi:hypothetical protein
MSHGFVCHFPSSQTPSSVSPILGTNMRQVVSAMVVTNKRPAGLDTEPAVPSALLLSGDMIPIRNYYTNLYQILKRV